MSLILKPPLSKHNQFHVRRAKQRKYPSRSFQEFSYQEYENEFGPSYRTIDFRIGCQRLVYDVENGIWLFSNVIKSPYLDELKKQKLVLEESKVSLSTKVDILLEMLAEATAEYDLQENSQ